MEHRVRTFWAALSTRAADLATLAGAIAGCGMVAALWPVAPDAWSQRGFLTVAAATILLGALVPRLLVKTCWRMIRRRKHEEWS